MKKIIIKLKLLKDKNIQVKLKIEEKARIFFRCIKRCSLLIVNKIVKTVHVKYKWGRVE